MSKPLDDDQVEKVESFLKYHQTKCPVCAQQDFEVKRILGGIPSTVPQGGGLGIGPALLGPLVTVVCKDCGYVLNFTVGKLGI